MRKLKSLGLRRGLEPDIMDGFAWVGLVLLTERGVSSSHPWGRVLMPPIDHLGANISHLALDLLCVATKGHMCCTTVYPASSSGPWNAQVPKQCKLFSRACFQFPVIMRIWSGILAFLGARVAGIPYFPATMCSAQKCFFAMLVLEDAGDLDATLAKVAVGRLRTFRQEDRLRHA